MTIIQPAKNKNKLSVFIILAVIFIAAGFYIYEYNLIVNVNYHIGALEKTINDYRSTNADLKSQYYKLTDPLSLENFAEKSGLILDQQPKRLGFNQ